MTYGFGLMIESLVAILLLLTICYCVALNGRLKRLRADEGSLKETIQELIVATEIAERAVAGLKSTARECESTLGERLNTAERFSTDLRRQVQAGEIMVGKLNRLALVVKPAVDGAPETAPVPNTKVLAAAAQAFADRLRERMSALAA